SAPASTNPQSPLILPGEIPDTSTQAASTTATAPGASSPMCPPPSPHPTGALPTWGGSAACRLMDAEVRLRFRPGLRLGQLKVLAVTPWALTHRIAPILSS